MYSLTSHDPSRANAPLLVIGHKNPDTDAVCSAIAYAELLRRTGVESATAACCGGLSPRTQWVLEQAGQEPPVLVMDVRPTAAGICRRDVVMARDSETFLDVYHRMKEADLRALPVLDAGNRVVGVPSLNDLMELLMHSTESRATKPDEARKLQTTLANVAATLQAEVLCGHRLDDDQDFILMVAASSESLFSERLDRYPHEKLLLIVGDRPVVIEMAIEHEVRAILLTGGYRPPAELVARAESAGVTLLCYPFDTASAVQLLRCSRAIGSAVSRDFLAIPGSTLVSVLPAMVHELHQALFPVLADETGDLIGVFSKSDLIDPPRQRLVLVDHNEFSQAVTGANEAEILEVIDHHRISGNLVSREPIRFINEPLGSTSTIVARAFRQHGMEPSRAAVVCLCGGIISDTLYLTSPTTTATDREILLWLAGLAGIDMDEFARGFFAAGAMLAHWPADSMLGLDRKEFFEHGWSISISQIEENGLEAFPRRQAELEAALEQLRGERKLDCAAAIITDVRQHYSLLLITGAEEIIGGIDYPREKHGVFRMDGVVSRKKQFFPYISRVLAKAKRTSEGSAAS